ncbi:MAG: hypothetical protein DRO88_01485 [Promethearchaeia archaeon]|nr:MAG: hypothetical protein DRO88_01485 [Candidatus Lokiarchaeia archaeon]
MGSKYRFFTCGKTKFLSYNLPFELKNFYSIKEKKGRWGMKESKKQNEKKVSRMESIKIGKTKEKKPR